jgi:hypothetical protein
VTFVNGVATQSVFTINNGDGTGSVTLNGGTPYTYGPSDTLGVTSGVTTATGVILADGLPTVTTSGITGTQTVTLIPGGTDTQLTGPDGTVTDTTVQGPIQNIAIIPGNGAPPYSYSITQISPTLSIITSDGITVQYNPADTATPTVNSAGQITALVEDPNNPGNLIPAIYGPNGPMYAGDPTADPSLPDLTSIFGAPTLNDGSPDLSSEIDQMLDDIFNSAENTGPGVSLPQTQMEYAMGMAALEGLQPAASPPANNYSITSNWPTTLVETGNSGTVATVYFNPNDPLTTPVAEAVNASNSAQFALQQELAAMEGLPAPTQYMNNGDTIVINGSTLTETNSSGHTIATVNLANAYGTKGVSIA